MRVPVALLAVAVTTSLVACGRDTAGKPDGDIGSSTNTETPESREEATSQPQAAPAPTAAGSLFHVVVRSGGVNGGVQRFKVPLGEAVTLMVTSDVADTVHVHGYDVEQHVGAGQTIHVAFTASIPGVFEVELEDASLKIAELAVGG